MPPELLGKTPSAPKHLVFGPSANAAALGAFSFHVDQIPLGVILLGPVTVSYDGAGSWLIEAEAEIPYPIPTKVKGRLVIVAGHVKEVDLELQGRAADADPDRHQRARAAHRLRPEGRGQAGVHQDRRPRRDDAV